MTILGLLVMAMMLISAVKAITTTRLIDSVLFYSFTGIGATILFALMKAPDVAITEAAVGTGLVTLVFLSALRRTSEQEHGDER